MFGIGGSEILFIILISIMLFGADKIPDIARTIAKGLAQLKHATDDIKHEITKSVDEAGITAEIDKAKQGFQTMIDETVPENPMKIDAIDDFKTEIDVAKTTLNDIKDGPIKRMF
jgi:sec-independent protein translocase protein TatA